MRYKSTLLACMALLLTAPTVQSASLDKNGRDNKIEWQVSANWKLASKPVDIVHSLDGAKVFILDADHRVLVYDNTGQLEGKIPVDEGVTAIDIAPQGEALYLINDEANTFTKVQLSFVQDIDIAGSPFKGKADAPVTVAVFTDFQCPYCSKLEPLLDQVFANNKDYIKMVFKNMPLYKIHKMADPAHRAAMAAAMQGKFWEFHDKLFAADKLSNDFIDATASEIGLDMEKFKKDMNSNTVRQQIRKDLTDAQKAGVTGTPTVFVNGKKLSQRSLQGFQEIIDEELARLQKGE